MIDVGLIVVTAFILPLRTDRETARELIGAGGSTRALPR
ncbi:adenylyl-sulfate kinase [Ralstonia flatus]|uniref:APS kinase domain-containing protein n=1 Tax=Ralstonia flatus TaxID=3058601 RepID=A0AAD2C4H1_9RALS|nr:adenylyl-sulfate kinase [Ralstonia sp. LMG 32965]MBN6207774.1 adenylyl-sulfate kinase [Ralstonia pickettii]CAJ0887952.1 hypothetical protein R77567_03978 [Ralstonia sp. LMG 32965]CAJ0900482.1 hypothetical protein R77564_04453 [Ralstonia sp. LMG 32965]